MTTAAAAVAAAAATPAADTPAAPAADQLQLDHQRALLAQTPVSLAGNAIGGALMALVFWPLAPRVTLLSWLGAVAVLWLLRLRHYGRVRRWPDADDAIVRRLRRGWTWLVLAQGAMWGLAIWLFWGLGETYHQLVLLLVVYTYCLGAVHLLATQWRVFLAFVALVFVPAIVRVASDPAQPWHLPLAGVLLLLFAITLVMAQSSRTALGQVIRLKARADEEALQLRLQRAEADAARRAAETANRAKTQFFAAASHDLRQPLHAMGLFAEALRQRAQDPEVAGLVNSINASVDALEGLFSELLDITRIDSGGVEARAVPVRMQDLFARVRLHFEPVAFEKGLQLNFRGGHRVADADPVLLERVLRNLVSNALRYTEDGGVLVACRARAGKLLLQVWDSGIGIDTALQPRVFDEFFQAHGARPLAAHQRKGLGLGLAIVKRLADLMGVSLSLRSVVGRGSVFALELPVGHRMTERESLSRGAGAPPGITLQGRCFVVVEDEASVRDGLVLLLRDWGATVLAFDSLAALQAWLVRTPAERLPAAPDLLLLDYRLGDGATGLEALAALRAHWPGRTLPAIVITGSSLDGHEDQAVAHDYHLLVKPVLPARLRALIAFKLGLRAPLPGQT